MKCWMAEENIVLMMTDLEDSTGGWDRNRKAMLGLLEAYIDLVERRLQPPPRIEGFTGDGHVLSYPSVDAAATASLRLRELWERRESTLERTGSKARHRIKVGIHVGRCIRMEDGRLLGNPLNICARVLGETRPGEILISEPAFWDFNEKAHFAFGSPQLVKLKGYHFGEAVAVEPSGHDVGLTRARHGTNVYPLFGRAGHPDEVTLPDEAELLRRRISQQMRDEITAMCLTDKAGSEEELALVRNWVELERDSKEAHCCLGDVLTIRGDLFDAERAYREAIRLEPDYAEAYNNLGVVFAQWDKKSDAEESFRKAIKLKPDYAEAHRNLGHLLKSLGDESGAEQEYREAVRLQPEYAEAHNSLGVLLAEKGDKSGAERAFREAIRLKPDYGPARKNLDGLLARRGD
ncbi:MAG: tetratricopeptide repeat protein [Armatimonadetes bacterium]|nr:tetratricopeptide repeat protein [Armatimonadota bacterium]